MAACFCDNLNIWAYSSAGRAYGSHPYETSSHGSGSLPIQQSDFPDFPLKIEYLKNPFFITFLIEKWSIWARSSAGRAFGSHPKGSGVRSSSGPPLNANPNPALCGGQFSFKQKDTPCRKWQGVFSFCLFWGSTLHRKSSTLQ